MFYYLNSVSLSGLGGKVMLKLKKSPESHEYCAEDWEVGITIQDSKQNVWIKLQQQFRCLTEPLESEDAVVGRRVTISLVLE